MGAVLGARIRAPKVVDRQSVYTFLGPRFEPKNGPVLGTAARSALHGLVNRSCPLVVVCAVGWLRGLDVFAYTC
jgi:hypothetical protein